MGADRVTPADAGPHWLPMLDMSGRPLRPLGDGQDSVLDRALRQVVRSLDDPNGVISAFQSFIGE